VKRVRLTGVRTLYVREGSLYSVRSLTLSQWRDSRMGVMCRFRSLDNSASKRVLDLLKPVKLTVWKVVRERIAVVKFRMDNGSV